MWMFFKGRIGRFLLKSQAQKGALRPCLRIWMINGHGLHNLWRSHFGVDEHPFATYFDVHQGYRVLTHSQILKHVPRVAVDVDVCLGVDFCLFPSKIPCPERCSLQKRRVTQLGPTRARMPLCSHATRSSKAKASAFQPGNEKWNEPKKFRPTGAWFPLFGNPQSISKHPVSVIPEISARSPEA